MQRSIWCVVPETRIFVAIVTQITQIFCSILSNRDVEDVIGHIKIHTSFSTFASRAVTANRQLDLSALRVKTLRQPKASPLFPSVVEVVFSKGAKLDVAFIGEINKLQLEVVPVVEGEGIGIDLLVEGQPLQRTFVVEFSRLVQPEPLELPHVGEL